VWARPMLKSNQHFYKSPAIVVMGPGQKFLTRVRSGQFFELGLGRVSHLWFGFEFGKFSLKTSNFSTFSLQVKKNLFGLGQKVPGSKASWPNYLLRVKRKLGSGQGPSLQPWHVNKQCSLVLPWVGLPVDFFAIWGLKIADMAGYWTCSFGS